MSLKIRRDVITLSSLFLTVSLARADVTLDVEFGFHRLFKLGHPFPLSVVITNPGSPLEGELQVEIWKGGAAKVMAPYPFFHRKEIFLAARSQRKIPFTVHPDSMARHLKVTFTGLDVEVTREFDLRGHFPPSPLILLAISSSTLLAVPLAGKSQAPVVTLSADELPSDTRAYQEVWAVVLYEQSLLGLSDLQRRALESWIYSGGGFVVLGGLHYALYQEASLAALLPIRVVGLKEVADLPNLKRHYGRDLSQTGNLWVQDAKVTEGEVLIAEGGSPILAMVSRGPKGFGRRRICGGAKPGN